MVLHCDINMPEGVCFYKQKRFPQVTVLQAQIHQWFLLGCAQGLVTMLPHWPGECTGITWAREEVRDQAYSLSNTLLSAPEVKKSILFLGDQIASHSVSLPLFKAATTLPLGSKLAAQEPLEDNPHADGSSG